MLDEAWSKERARLQAELDPATADAWTSIARLEAWSELSGVIALFARGEGEAGRPASGVVLPVAALAAAIRSVGGESGVGADLLRVAADAHAVGLGTRHGRRLARMLERSSPVLELPDGRVLACPVGHLDGDLIDAVLFRAFALAAASGAAEVVLDLSAATIADEQALLSTLRRFPEHERASALRLTVTGVDDLDLWREHLAGSPVDVRARLAS